MPSNRFPARVTEPARRLLRSLVLAMSTVDRPADLAALLEPLVREHRALGLRAGQYETLGVALIGAMRRFGGATWDDAAEHAWVRAFSLAAGPMEEVVTEQLLSATFGMPLVLSHEAGRYAARRRARRHAG